MKRRYVRHRHVRVLNNETIAGHAIGIECRCANREREPGNLRVRTAIVVW